jgi:5-methylcytosine-specific restriction enzyme B
MAREGPGARHEESHRERKASNFVVIAAKGALSFDAPDRGAAPGDGVGGAAIERLSMNPSPVTDPRFSWIPFYEELADKLLAYREPEGQRELLALLERLRGQGRTITPLEDKDEQGQRFLLREIDPFTFFGTFNRGISEDKRVRILEELKVFFAIAAAVPTGFAGVPVLNNMRSWFFAYQPERTADDVTRLWAVFERALGPAPLGSAAFARTFDEALEVNGTNINLTMGLFWIRPRTFLTLDSTLRSHLGLKLPSGGLTFAYYEQTLRTVRSGTSTGFPELSREAWTKLNNPSAGSNAPIPAPPLLEAEYWLVGSYWDSEDPPDQTDHFLAEGVWRNGYDDRFLDVVRQMKPGDRIAIKATTTQRTDLPFDSRGHTVSRLLIKARGTIVRNRGDGRTVEVEWEPRGSSRDWYFYTARPAVWHLRKDRELAQALIRFAFFDEPQDYVMFTERWWGKAADAPHDLPVDNDVDTAMPYAIADVLAEGVFLQESEVQQALTRLQSKKAMVLQGAPGVGKTYLARKLAYALMEARDDARVTVVQFHPSFSYEDFIRGYRPTGEAGKFELRDGPFMRVCEQAGKDRDRRHVLIIDEINRGHLSQVFGELFMLLEADKRGPRHALTPLYRRSDGETFHIPENVYVIGTMNIADRSLALVDFALRRRFAFVTLEPQFSSVLFRSWLHDRKMPEPLVDRIVQRMMALNTRIADDAQLGPAFRIGHSFFCPRGDDFSALDGAWFKAIVDTEIVPLLEEYWHDAPEKVRSAAAELRQ